MTEDVVVYEAVDEAATSALGAVLADLLPGGTTVALSGTLGAGKTRLVQAIAEASGVNRRDVVSPTFVLVQQYSGRRPVYHLDAYRLRDEDEFVDLGPDEYFESDGLTLVEWAERVEGALPKQRLEIQVDVTGLVARSFTIRGIGKGWSEWLEQLRTRLRSVNST